MSKRFTRRVTSYLADHEGRRIGLHGLRHSFITSLITNGVDLLTVSRLAGHHSLHYTGDVYGHLMPGVARAAVDQLEAALGGQA